MDSANGQQFEFRGFRLDRRKRSLVDPDGIAIALNTKAFDTLVYFLEHPGEVIERSTLLAAVWPSTVVEENNLSQAVAALRRVLGDGFIVTVTGRGYQFVAEVRPGEAPSVERARERLRRPWLYASSAVLLLGLAGVVLSSRGPDASLDRREPAASEDPRSVAVLPFANESAAEEKAAFFANGIHDELLSRLVKVRDLKVIARGSVEAYRDSPKTRQEIGRELGVASLVEGRVQRSADRVRISVRLVDVETDEHLWAQTYDRALDAENIFDIQRDMAVSIAGALRAALSPDELTLLRNVPTKSTKAYDFFLTGVEYFRNRTDPQNFIPLAMQSLERAVEEDPEFAWGWAILSVMHGEMYWFHFDRSEERLARAEDAARRALELAPDLPEMHLAMAMFHFRSALDYDAALAELAIAEEACPECTEILSVRGSVNRRRGRFEASLQDFDRILERDPRNLFQLSAHHLVNYEYLRDYDRAAETAERILELAPDDAGARHERAWIPMLREGDTTLLGEHARERESSTPAYWADPSVREDLWLAAMYEREYDRAIEAISYSDPSVRSPVPPELYVGLAELCAGRSERAAMALHSVRNEIERSLDRITGDPATEAFLRAQYGYTLAGLGEHEAAVAAVRRARTVMPKTKDALVGATIQYHATFVLALAGAEDEAIDELDDYLSGPGPWSIEGLLPDPRLDPIRDNPRLEALVERHRR